MSDEDEFFNEIDEHAMLVHYAKEYPDLVDIYEGPNDEVLGMSLVQSMLRLRDIPDDAVYLRSRDGGPLDRPFGQKVYQSPLVRKQNDEFKGRD